jgi:hypothetical protein
MLHITQAKGGWNPTIDTTPTEPLSPAYLKSRKVMIDG